MVGACFGGVLRPSSIWRVLIPLFVLPRFVRNKGFDNCSAQRPRNIAHFKATIFGAFWAFNTMAISRWNAGKSSTDIQLGFFEFWASLVRKWDLGPPILICLMILQLSRQERAFPHRSSYPRCFIQGSFGGFPHDLHANPPSLGFLFISRFRWGLLFPLWLFTRILFGPTSPNPSLWRFFVLVLFGSFRLGCGPNHKAKKYEKQRKNNRKNKRKKRMPKKTSDKRKWED